MASSAAAEGAAAKAEEGLAETLIPPQLSVTSWPSSPTQQDGAAGPADPGLQSPTSVLGTPELQQASEGAWAFTPDPAQSSTVSAQLSPNVQQAPEQDVPLTPDPGPPSPAPSTPLQQPEAAVSFPPEQTQLSAEAPPEAADGEPAGEVVASEVEAATGTTAHSGAAPRAPPSEPRLGPREAASPPPPLPGSSPWPTLSGEEAPADPHDLRRYTKLQAREFEEALAEIRAGRKVGHWIWFIIPTPPYIVDGVELGSHMNQYYALRSDAQAEAYLRFEAQGVNLRQNYLAIMSEVLAQLRRGNPVLDLMGQADVPKLISSAEYFSRIARKCNDEAVWQVCDGVLAEAAPEKLEQSWPEGAEEAAAEGVLDVFDAPQTPPQQRGSGRCFGCVWGDRIAQAITNSRVCLCFNYRTHD